MPDEVQEPKITLAAVALAAVLYKVVNSGPVGAQMQQLIERALRGSF
nr:DUF4244 domain-containing protein [Streptomyces sp. HPH0547]